MTDKVKEIAEKLWDKYSSQYVGSIKAMLFNQFCQAIQEATASQSAEIERLNGIIERAKEVRAIILTDPFDRISSYYMVRKNELDAILSEAKKG